MERRFIRANDLELSYLVAGQGDAMVLVHGWPTHSHLWRHQIPVLAEHFRVLALDLPGFGDSDKPTDVRYSLDLFVDAFSGFLDALGLKDVTLVCHDIGGPIALLWAVRHAERLSRLVVMDTTPYPDLPLLIQLLLSAARLPGVGRLLVSRLGLRLLFHVGTARRGVVTDELVAAYDRPFADNPAARKTLLRILAQMDPREMDEIANNLGRIAVPTLILWGEKDPSAPLSVARRLQADIPGAVLKTVPNCGHFLSEDCPDDVNQALLEFLTSQQTGFESE